MASLNDKFEIAIGEIRLLILGVQVLVGMEYESALEKDFGLLTKASQDLKMGSLILLLACMGLIFSPVPYHRIVQKGETNPDVLAYIARMTEVGLFPFAVALGIDLYVAGDGVLQRGFAIASGVAASLAALAMWYAWEWVKTAQRHEDKRNARAAEEEKVKPTSLTDKLKNVLQEERMVLPGVQALLGFQLIVFLMEGFKTLPKLSQYIHLGSLWLITASIILLISPAAFHRIVEHGEPSESFHRLAGGIMLASMAPLGLGLCGDLYVVIAKVISPAIAAAASTLMLLFFSALWFAFPLYMRAHKKP